MSEFVECKEYETKKYRINVFDDGNQKIENTYENIWLIIGTNNKGKVRLQNVKDQTFFVDSISMWKVQIIEEEYILYSKFTK
jgi:hypothetical protein